MDLSASFNEKALIIPRNYKITYKYIKEDDNHHAIIGIGTIINDYPLLAEGCNEKGVSIAALNFPSNAKYYLKDENKINLAPYELMLYILSKCDNIGQVKLMLNDINIIDEDFNNDIKNTPLHFMVSDKNHSIVIETLNDKMHVIDNPYNILTNNPPFRFHIENLNNYMNLSIEEPKNNFDKNLNLSPYSYGMGAMHLPGDFSSSSRFIKALFIKNNMEMFNDEFSNVIQFFSCLESVKMVKGLVKTPFGFEYTRYTSCYNMERGLLYYKTYDSPFINIIDMHEEKLNSTHLINYELASGFVLTKQNKKNSTEFIE